MRLRLRSWSFVKSKLMTFHCIFQSVAYQNQQTKVQHIQKSANFHWEKLVQVLDRKFFFGGLGIAPFFFNFDILIFDEINFFPLHNVC